MHLKELKKKTSAELVEMAEELGVEGASTMRRQDLMFCILRELAEETGMTMLCVTHEMGFARKVADRVIFMDQGQIVEQNTPTEFFNNPQSDRTKLFLSQILGH